MTHPAIIFAPLLILSTFFLIYLNSNIRQRTYASHIKIDDEQINHQIKKAANIQSLLNWRKLVAVLAIGLGLYYLGEVLHHEYAYEFAVGYVLGIYGIILGRQIFNFALFRFFERNLSEMQGEVTYSGRAVNYVSALDVLPVLPVILFFLWERQDAFSWGMAMGMLLLLLIQMFGAAKKARRQ